MNFIYLILFLYSINRHNNNKYLIDDFNRVILELNPNGNKCSESDYINASHIDVCCFEIIDII